MNAPTNCGKAVAELLISSIVMLAALVQSIAGFGFALVAMSLLPGVIDIKIAVPLVALVSISFNSALYFIYRRHLNFKTVLRLSLATLVAMPVGIALLTLLPETLVLRGLGWLIISYTVYDLLNLTLPALRSPRWAYAFGALSGILTGAYNTGGPLVIYGNCSGWTPETFKGNLPAFFLLSSVFAASSHALAGNLTKTVWLLALYAMPAFAVGLGVGVRCANRLPPQTFRRIILILLLLAGFRLIWG